MNYCTDVNVLKIIFVIKTIIKIITYIIPIILIVFIMIDFFKAITGDEKGLENAVNKSIKRFIAAVVIFFVPTIVNAVFNLVGNNNTILSCITNATSEKISVLKIDKVQNLVDTVKKTYDEDDYIVAKNAINKLDNKEERERLEKELESTKEAVYLNKEIKEIQYKISQIKNNYTEENYNSLINRINALGNSNQKSSLLASLESSKEEYMKTHDMVPMPLDIETGVHERSDFDSEMRYVEVIPEGVTTKMPMVIYLHGIWSYASFSSNAPYYLITNYVKSGNAYSGGKFILVVPRFVLSEGDSRGMVTWQTNQGKEQTKKLKELIDFLISKYKLNKNKIYITGVSLGGDGTWNMVESYPSLFAGAVPISGCASSNPVIDNYLSTPIIAYHGTGALEDAYKNCVPRIYNRIKSAGGNIELRVKNGYSHAQMQNVYSDSSDNIFEWMLKQERK